MKKTIIIATLCLGFAAVLLKSGKAPSVIDVQIPKKAWAHIAGWVQPTLDGGTESVAETPAASPFSQTAKSVEDLYFKVVRTPQEKAAWAEMVSSKENIDSAVQGIQNYDASNVKANEAARMEAVLFLVRALEFEGNKNKEYVQQKVSDLILDASVETITNKDLKRSVIADRVELFVSAKDKYPALGQKIQNSATSKLQKDFIMFANNFYDLDKKGEVK